MSSSPTKIKGVIDAKAYNNIHYWVRVQMGKASYCSNDPTHEARNYEWANISGKYKRDLADFKPLCKSCHYKFDFKPESLVNKRNAHLGKPTYWLRRKVVATDIETGKTYHFVSIREAAKQMGIDARNISTNLSGRGKILRKKYKFVYE